MLGAADAARGDEAPDEYEAPVLERFLPELEAHLGADEVKAFATEGRALD